MINPTSSGFLGDSSKIVDDAEAKETLSTPMSNPPIVPALACIEPLISIPAAEADNPVVLAAVFISNAPLVSFKCLPVLLPIVVVAPNVASVVVPRFISTLLLSMIT